MQAAMHSACEAALEAGRLDELRTLAAAALAQRAPGDARPFYFASHHLSREEAIDHLFAAIATNPGFRPAMLRLADLFGEDTAVRSALEYGAIRDPIVPPRHHAAFEGEVGWRSLPAEPPVTLPEPIGRLHETYPIPTGETLSPIPLHGTLVEGGLLDWDHRHAEAFVGDAPLRMHADQENAGFVIAAARERVAAGRIRDFGDATVHVVGARGARSFYHWMIDMAPLVEAARVPFPEIPVERSALRGGCDRTMTGLPRQVRASPRSRRRPAVVRSGSRAGRPSPDASAPVRPAAPMAAPRGRAP